MKNRKYLEKKQNFTKIVIFHFFYNLVNDMVVFYN